MLENDLTRRAFLKTSAAGSAFTALHPSTLATPAQSLASPPSLHDLAAVPQRYRYRDLFNCPAVMNELGYAQVGKSVSAITAIAFPPFACCGVPEMPWSPGFLLTAELFLDGKFVAVAAEPDGVIEYQWFPHRVIRKQTVDRLQITTCLFLPSQLRAAAQSITLKNLARSSRRFTLGFDLRGAVAKKTTPWFANSPGEADNKLTYLEQQGCLLFEARHSEIAAAQGFNLKPTRVEQQRMFLFDLHLGPGESTKLNFVAAVAEEGRAAQALFARIHSQFEHLQQTNESAFTSLVRDAFTHGNSNFSGNLPRLHTKSEALWKLYHNGFANLLFARRHSPDSKYGPTYLTLSGHVLPTLSFPWDTALSSLSLALLDPEPLKSLVEVWLRSDMHAHHSTCYVSGEPVGPWYAANDMAIVRCAWRYVCVTGNFAWLTRKIGDRTVLEHLESHALYWQKLDRSGHGLADYGGIENILEVVSTYIHEVAGLNAQNVSSMRAVADMQERVGNSTRAGQLRAEAKALAQRIQQSLYVNGKGYWRAGQPDGSHLEVRHCYDFLAVLDSMAPDLSPAQKTEMADFFWRELRTRKWMRALSQSDVDATWNIRPDHSCLGAYAAWPAMCAKGLYKTNSTSQLPTWLAEVAKAGNQGPIGQGHFVEDAFPPVNGGAFKASNDAPYIEDWCCIAGGAFSDLVIDSIFGADLTMSDGIKVRSQLAGFDADAKLEGLRYQGGLYSISKSGAVKQSL